MKDWTCNQRVGNCHETYIQFYFCLNSHGLLIQCSNLSEIFVSKLDISVRVSRSAYYIFCVWKSILKPLFLLLFFFVNNYQYERSHREAFTSIFTYRQYKLQKSGIGSKTIQCHVSGLNWHDPHWKEIATSGHIWLITISLLKYHQYLTCSQCLLTCWYGPYNLVSFKALLFPKIFIDMTRNP